MIGEERTDVWKVIQRAIADGRVSRRHLLKYLGVGAGTISCFVISVVMAG